MSVLRTSIAATIVVLTTVAALPANATSVLGSSATFAVLAGSTVTNTGPSSVNGDVGVAPGTALTGMGSVTLNGTLQDDTAAAATAQTDAATAFVALAALPFTTDLTGQDLGSVGVLTPGVYRFDSSAQLTGALVLDFEGLHNQSFVFQIGSALTTASLSSIVVENGDVGSSIFWEIGSSATLGTGTTFAGNIIADQSITLTTGASILCGRAIALNAAVTMDTDVVSSSCSGGGDYGTGRSDFGSDGFSGVNVYKSAVPEPAAWALMLLGLGGIGGAARMARRRDRSIA